MESNHSLRSLPSQPKVAVIGLGYVGLPLAVAFSRHVPVLGFDINAARVAELNGGEDRTLEVTPAELQKALAGGARFSAQKADLADCNTYIVTVPTPIDNYKTPDLGPLLAASKTIGSVLKPGDVVVYESTTYPGCTEEDCVPVLEQTSGLVFNRDFYCGYSPERINPGDKVNTLATIRKVTSGSTPEAAAWVDALYQKIITAGTFCASSMRVAEASKAIENAQRDVNISFVNELALIFDRLGIDTQEVLRAAGTKWNFLPFQPGLVGGHCIGVDPYYLAHKAKAVGYHPKVILSGRDVNDQMSAFVSHKLIQLLAQNGKQIQGAKVLVLGVTFKENCPDFRNSKVFDIIGQLKKEGADVSAFDPYANAMEVFQKYQVSLITAFEQYDVILLAVAHDFFKALDYASLKTSPAAIVYDTKAFLDRSIVTARL